MLYLIKLNIWIQLYLSLILFCDNIISNIKNKIFIMSCIRFNDQSDSENIIVKCRFQSLFLFDLMDKIFFHEQAKILDGTNNIIKFQSHWWKNFLYYCNVYHFVTMNPHLVDNCHHPWKVIHNQFSWNHSKCFELRPKSLKLLPLCSCWSLIFFLYRILYLLGGFFAKNCFQD